jgi:glycosyltransferase involved in cell wall biosynthesis
VTASRSAVVPPETVDRLIVHQWDAAHPGPGGIDTCLRGIVRYAPADVSIAVAGVDATGGTSRPLGVWEHYRFNDRELWFLPVSRLDSGNQVRRVPHSLRVALGAARFRARLPKSRVVQVHRMDLALFANAALRRPLAYFVHTQERGLISGSSDSFWRHLGDAHTRLERRVVRGADNVVVFNIDYAESVRRWNPRTMASPTWYDPALFAPQADRDRFAVVWVGRFEVPKDPLLAIASFRALTDSDPETPWSMTLVGSGTLDGEVAAAHAGLPEDVRRRVRLAGRLAPDEVAETMGRGGVFLMTSQPGYEGYPRVLVEAIASGLVPVVTDGSDTGGLVGERVGYVTDRDPNRIARSIRDTVTISRDDVLAAAQPLRADIIVNRILTPSQW